MSVEAAEEMLRRAAAIVARERRREKERRGDGERGSDIGSDGGVTAIVERAVEDAVERGGVEERVVDGKGKRGGEREREREAEKEREDGGGREEEDGGEVSGDERRTVTFAGEETRDEERRERRERREEFTHTIDPFTSLPTSQPPSLVSSPRDGVTGEGGPPSFQFTEADSAPESASASVSERSVGGGRRMEPETRRSKTEEEEAAQYGRNKKSLAVKTSSPSPSPPSPAHSHSPSPRSPRRRGGRKSSNKSSPSPFPHSHVTSSSPHTPTSKKSPLPPPPSPSPQPPPSSAGSVQDGEHGSARRRRRKQREEREMRSISPRSEIPASPSRKREEAERSPFPSSPRRSPPPFLTRQGSGKITTRGKSGLLMQMHQRIGGSGQLPIGRGAVAAAAAAAAAASLSPFATTSSASHASSSSVSRRGRDIRPRDTRVEDGEGEVSMSDGEGGHTARSTTASTTSDHGRDEHALGRVDDDEETSQSSSTHHAPPPIQITPRQTNGTPSGSPRQVTPESRAESKGMSRSTTQSSAMYGHSVSPSGRSPKIPSGQSSRKSSGKSHITPHTATRSSASFQLFSPKGDSDLEDVMRSESQEQPLARVESLHLSEFGAESVEEEGTDEEEEEEALARAGVPVVATAGPMSMDKMIHSHSSKKGDTWKRRSGGILAEDIVEQDGEEDDEEEEDVVQEDGMLVHLETMSDAAQTDDGTDGHLSLPSEPVWTTRKSAQRVDVDGGAAMPSEGNVRGESSGRGEYADALEELLHSPSLGVIHVDDASIDSSSRREGTSTVTGTATVALSRAHPHGSAPRGVGGGPPSLPGTFFPDGGVPGTSVGSRGEETSFTGRTPRAHSRQSGIEGAAGDDTSGGEGFAQTPRSHKGGHVSGSLMSISSGKGSEEDMKDLKDVVGGSGGGSGDATDGAGYGGGERELRSRRSAPSSRDFRDSATVIDHPPATSYLPPLDSRSEAGRRGVRRK